MDQKLLNDLEVASNSVVRQAARDFARALVATAQYQAFEQADEQFNQDASAQKALEAYQSKNQSLRAMRMLAAIPAEDQAELERLKGDLLAQPSMVQYSQAQADLVALCQATADRVSQQIGLDYASACSPGGCC